MSKSEAYWKGYNSYKVNSPTPDCPFSSDSGNAVDFWDGYGDAYNEYWDNYVPPRPNNVKTVCHNGMEYEVNEDGEIL